MRACFHRTAWETWRASGERHHPWVTVAAVQLKTSVSFSRGSSLWVLWDWSTWSKRGGVGSTPSPCHLEQRKPAGQCLTAEGGNGTGGRGLMRQTATWGLPGLMNYLKAKSQVVIIDVWTCMCLRTKCTFLAFHFCSITVGIWHINFR